ncbi:MAG TPA: DEAD/DEAH box helicase [Acidimicrobiales bacterium]|nr:DEAD/DEAH box helicase [Acidimicrobiales bacterium]
MPARLQTYMEQTMQPTFADLGVPEDIAANLRKRGIENPFPIQASALPGALEGRDVCGKAPTGSGKTFAFGIPLVARVGRAKPRKPRALVLAPTRELASQIEMELRPLLRLRGKSAVAVYGGVGMEPQVRALRRGADVVVACPGRLKDLMDRGAIDLSETDFVVIDEADRMADMGFLPEVRRILDKVRPNRQTLLFSATLDGDVDVLIRNYQKDPVRCEIVADAAEVDRTEHRFIDTDQHSRVDLTAELIREHGSAAIFCRTKHGADRIAQQLTRVGVRAVAIHGNRSQAQRDRALASFKSGAVEALVATDVAARGIHVDDVGCVVHFDPPADSKDYIHRSGRTGRAGADGLVISLVTSSTHAQVRTLKKQLGFEVGPEPANMPKATGRKTGRPQRGQGGPKSSGGYARRGATNGRTATRGPEGHGRSAAGSGHGRTAARGQEGRTARDGGHSARPARGPRTQRPRRAGRPTGR